ncbi:ABC transporter ATP-binding protein [Desulfobacter hydrogenophilus]|uniref:ABC transporter ATP-binding protein n=1 Tax=Desulfobacter hydrogenophilus TaxID=2291 RepID=A0A328FHX3_9BACT|nr:ABC transporter ATP-binding protein [Desulfobacter hydrogenophilus]NDY71842.1 ABC transporter ATP-binding protein [Desulfobacter hydrogenophilus]QBH15503.1 ABC transporter ATP-binding protein [Desulfobacter hydrogenophilus]RAM02617.1 ABC transporter ATP-binding protein [Desulfobacter hydrogenophilus]
MTASLPLGLSDVKTSKEIIVQDQPLKKSLPAFTTKALTKIYGEGAAAVHALRGVDLEIPSGEMVVLLGPSGSGKSTLLNIIGGLDRASEGTVFFQDQELSDMTDEQLTRYRRDHVGFVFQFYNLMPSLTAHENVELVTEIASDPMDPEEALGLVGLRDRADHFPSQLSGGEQQRVAIARAVAKQPTVLFCDEPTGALDSTTGRTVLQVLKDINETLGATVLIVTHAAATADMADRVIHFADGAIREIVVNKTKLGPEDIEW